MRPYIDLTDEELIAEIKAYRAAKRKIAMGGDVAVIAGESRRLEFTRSSSTVLDTELRSLYYEARKRGLDIGGTGGAIAVEIGR